MIKSQSAVTTAESPLLPNPVLECRELSKQYRDTVSTVQVLRAINLAIAPGETVAVLGASGSGKSTLLQIMGLLDRPSSGELRLNGMPVADDERARSRLRATQIGFVYQFHHLLPEFSALENVSMPLRVQGIAPNQAQARAHEQLSLLGLEHRLNHRPGQLSGGERQRVAMARALVTQPPLLLADEPTGNLDRHTAMHVFETLLRARAQLGTAFVLVTHDITLARSCDRILTLVDGVVQSAAANPRSGPDSIFSN